jgi:hypothetical protein
MQTATRPTRMTHPWVAQASETIRFGLAYGEPSHNSGVMHQFL